MAAGEIRSEAIWEKAAATHSRAASRPRSSARSTRPASCSTRTSAGRRCPAPARAAILEAAAGYATVEYDAARGARGKRQDHVRALARDLFGVRRRARRQQQRGGRLARPVRARARPQRARLARRARRDRRLLQDPRDPRGLRARACARSGRPTARRSTTTARRSAPEVALLLSVHPSNYEIRGYTAPPGAARARAARPRGRDSVAARPRHRGGRAARRVRRARRADGGGVSRRGRGPRRRSPADKLFSGPQAGFLAGSAELVARAAAHPVARAVRPDKLTLAALAATLAAWKTGAWRQFPVYRAAGAPPRRARASAARAIRDARARGGSTVRVVPSLARVRRRHEPGEALPVARARAHARDPLGRRLSPPRLRSATPPVVARVEGGPRPARPALDPARGGRARRGRARPAGLTRQCDNRGMIRRSTPRVLAAGPADPGAALPGRRLPQEGGGNRRRAAAGIASLQGHGPHDAAAPAAHRDDVEGRDASARPAGIDAARACYASSRPCSRSLASKRRGVRPAASAAAVRSPSRLLEGAHEPDALGRRAAALAHLLERLVARRLEEARARGPGAGAARR